MLESWLRRKSASVTVPITAVCSNCRTSYGLDAYISVDAETDPDLADLDSLRGLRSCTCPNGHAGSFDLPLLVYRPGQEPEAVFFCTTAADRGLAANELSEALQCLALAKTRPSDPQALYEATCVVPLDRLRTLEGLNPSHVLAGTTLRFFSLVDEARSPPRDACPTADRTVAGWETVVQHPEFDAAPAWFRRAASAEAAAAHHGRVCAQASLPDIDRAIALFRSAMDLAPPDAAAQAPLSYNLGAALMQRFGMAGEPADGHEAVARLEAGLVGGRGLRLAHMRLSLAEALLATHPMPWHEASRARARALLEEAGTEASVADSPRYAVALAGATNVAGDHRVAVVTRAIEHLQATLRDPTITDEERRRLSEALACHQVNRHGLTGDLDDLSEAISHRKRLVMTAPSEALPGILSNLAESLMRRFERSGSIADLEAASSYCRRGLTLVKGTAWPADSLLNIWGMIARIFGQRDKDPEWLNQAYRAFMRARDLVRERGGPDNPYVLSNCGTVLVDIGWALESLEKLNSAIEHLEAALRATMPGDPEKALRLVSLALAFHARHDIGHDLEDLPRAAATLRDALTCTKAGSVDEAFVLGHLANALRRQASIPGLEGDGTDTHDMSRRSVKAAKGTSREAWFRAAMAWGIWAFDREAWPEATEALEAALDALDSLEEAQVDRHGRETWIRDAQSLAKLASYAHARCGNVMAAALAFERARARLIGAKLTMRDPRLEELRTLGFGDLLERFRARLSKVERREAGERLLGAVARETTGERLHRSSRGLSNSPDAFAWKLTSEMANVAAEERADLRECIGDIRSVPGFDDFLRSPTWDRTLSTLDPHATGLDAPSALVYVLSTSGGGAALVLTSQRQDVVLLPGLSTAGLDEHVFVGGGFAAAQGGADAEMEGLPASLRWLGEVVVAPVMRALEASGFGQAGVRASLLLVPAGALSTLPLHACPFDEEGRCLLDVGAVNFGISAASWRHCRRLASTAAEGGARLVAVADPEPHDGFARLPAARIETEVAVSALPEGAIVLAGKDATPEEVLHRVAEATYVHFACHATFDGADANDAKLLLSGGDLPLWQLATKTEIKRGRLAVLSACQTAVVDLEKFPEEAVGLASAFIEAGMAGVVGTLWPLDDVSAPLVFARFYELHACEGGPRLPPADALRAAQLWLRDLEADEVAGLLRDTPTGRKLVEAGLAGDLVTDASDKPFAHPYFWASFTLSGA